MNASALRDFKNSILLDAQGHWWHEGIMFQNENLSELFHRSIAWSPDKERFVIRIGRDESDFDYDITPFSAGQFRLSPSDGVELILNNNSAIELRDNTIIYFIDSGSDCLTSGDVFSHPCFVRITRSLFQIFSTYITEAEQVVIGGFSFPLKTVSSFRDIL